MVFCVIDLERSKSTGLVNFWKPNKEGYTLYFSEAGIYSEEESNRILINDMDGKTVRMEYETAKKTIEFMKNHTDEEIDKIYSNLGVK